MFALTGIAAKYAGPSVCVSFLISGLVALSSGLMYAELSSRIPKSGSGFNYAYCTSGEIFAWLVGWNQTLRFLGSSSALSRGLVSYFNGLVEKCGG